MKALKLIANSITVTVVVILCVNCRDEVPEPTSIRVQSVRLDETLKQGVTVVSGSEPINIADRITIFPENASNKKPIFSSSNKNVATIDEDGKVVVHGAGTATITVIVDGKSDQFTITVAPEPPILVTDIVISIPSVELTVGESVDVVESVTVLPVEASNKAVLYSVADPSVARVEQNGVITGVSGGTTVVTVTSLQVPSVKAEISVHVNEPEPTGDYDRSTWTVSASQNPLPNTDGNSLSGAIDGNVSSLFILVRPSKNVFGVNVPAASNGGHVHFTIDMKEQRKVNYFRLRHRANNTSNPVALRYLMIEKVLGSNDGENFTEIASNVEVTDARTLDILESPNISIPTSTYRYIRFYCAKDECWLSMSAGATTQLAEIYLGNE